jgi:hypothetical protein
MVLNLNIVELITPPTTSWNKKYFIKNTFYYSIKLFNNVITYKIQSDKNYNFHNFLNVNKILSG